MVRYAVLALLTLGAACGSLQHGSRAVDSAATGNTVLGGMTAFAGGKFEASGVAAVPGTDGVLFVDDGRADEIFWMPLDERGKQAGDVKAVALGVSVEDAEGITGDGSHFYVVGSQSRKKAADGPGLLRFRFDARSQRVEGVEAVAGLKKFLVEHVDELREVGDLKNKDGGLNIEGLAWDQARGRLLLGLRSPVIDGHALVVPLSLRDPRGPFAADNLEVKGGRAIRLPLGGLGVRGIEYDDRAKLFRVISGAPESQEKQDFGLWEWDGDERQPEPRRTRAFDRSLQPEGVARVSAGGRYFTFVVFDSSGYSTAD